MPIDRYRGVSLQRELVDKIEEYVKTHPETGYKSMADFVTDSVRKRCEDLRILVPTPPPTLEHFNLTENGVTILDRSLEPPKGALVDVYFKPDQKNRLQARCEYDETDDCRHVRFALDLPEVQEILQKKGWRAK
jgi:hypothetical protein